MAVKMVNDYGSKVVPILKKEIEDNKKSINDIKNACNKTKEDIDDMKDDMNEKEDNLNNIQKQMNDSIAIPNSNFNNSKGNLQNGEYPTAPLIDVRKHKQKTLEQIKHDVWDDDRILSSNKNNRLLN